MRSLYWKGINVVTDTSWGDTGKGKIIDVAAQDADLVIRYNGGPNAGHTVKNNFGEFKLHLIPSGIFNKKALCVLATGVLVNPLSLVEEIKSLEAKGIRVSKKNLLISEDAHMIMPWHKILDTLSETTKGSKKIGTTGQGIGPAKKDKVGREGLLVGDLLKKDFKELFEKEFTRQQRLITFLAGKGEGSMDKKIIWQQLLQAKALLSSMITNVLAIIWDYQDKKKNILGEGAQGALLDLDLGGYPFVTSSNPGVAGFTIATGIQGKEVSNVVGVTKAYTTRVGEGPMPTELKDKMGAYLQEKGFEVGVTTGRKRRCGWLDIPATKYGARIAGVTTIALTKLDVLDSLSKIKLCVGYTIDGKEIKSPTTFSSHIIEKAKPIYETLPGWQEDTTVIRSFAKLPKNAKAYIARIEKLLFLPIDIISVGPSREATIYKQQR